MNCLNFYFYFDYFIFQKKVKEQTSSRSAAEELQLTGPSTSNSESFGTNRLDFEEHHHLPHQQHVVDEDDDDDIKEIVEVEVVQPKTSNHVKC